MMPEAGLLFQVMRDLRDRGVAVVFISHRLKEVLKIADRATVLRDGYLVGTVLAKDVKEKELIKMMVGREMTAFYPPKSSKIRNVLLEVVNLDTFTGIQEASFNVHQGEILGVAGLVGAGRTEMAKAIFGIDQIKNGKILIEGKPVTITSPAEAMALGMGYLPEERKVAGLYLEMGIKSNIISNDLHQVGTSTGFISGKLERKMALEYISQLDIQARSPEQLVLNLSGGNQQKVLIAKWITGKPKLLIIDEPTRGVDVGAKYEIHCLLRNMAEQGMAIIMISSDLPEILGMSDRIMVMRTEELP